MKKIVTITEEISIRKIGENFNLDVVLPRNAKKITRIAVCSSPNMPIISDAAFYGVAAAPNIPLTSAFIGTNLVRQPILGSNPPFTTTAGAGEFVYYCVPTRIGVRYLAFGLITGGFSLEATIPVLVLDSLTGITENFYIYKSNNPNLGLVTINVSTTP